MSLKISLVLLFILLLSKSLFVDASPILDILDDHKGKCDITKNSKEPHGGLPSAITPSANFKFLLYGSGAQIYRCNTTTSQKSWDFVGPQADLFTDPEHKVGKHFFQPTPVNGGRATWESVLNCDDSGVITKTITTYPVDSKNIPWLLTQTTGNIGGKGAFSDVKFVVRTNTKDGVAPPLSECGTKFHNNDLFKSDYSTEYWYFN